MEFLSLYIYSGTNFFPIVELVSVVLACHRQAVPLITIEIEVVVTPGATGGDWKTTEAFPISILRRCFTG